MTRIFETFDDARDHVVANMTGMMTGEAIDRRARSLLSPTLHPMRAAAPERSEAVAAATALRDHDATIVGIVADLDTLQAQRVALDRKAADLRAAEPRQPRTDTSLIDAIVADPDAALDTDAMAAAVEATRQTRVAMDAWNTNRAIVDAASSRINAQIVQKEATVAAARQARDKLFGDFAKVASAYLIGRLEAAFADLATDLFNPILALQRVTLSNGKTPLGYSDVRIDDRSHVGIKAWDANSHVQERTLLDARPLAANTLDSNAIVAQLLDTLAQDAAG